MPKSDSIKTSDIEGLNSAIALLLHGNENCASEVIPEEIAPEVVEESPVEETPVETEIQAEETEPEVQIPEPEVPKKKKGAGLFDILKKLVTDDE